MVAAHLIRGHYLHHGAMRYSSGELGGCRLRRSRRPICLVADTSANGINNPNATPWFRDLPLRRRSDEEETTGMEIVAGEVVRRGDARQPKAMKP